MSNTIAPGAHMAAEILEQPARWRDLLSAERGALEAAAQLIGDAKPELIVFAARGSSDHAAMYGQYLAHNLLGIPALLSTPSTLTAFGTELRYPTSVMLAVSQSGESPDLLDTVRAAARSGVPVIAFTNSEASALAALGDVRVSLSAGPELSVAATKTYTAELLALYLVLTLAAGGEWVSLEQQVVVAAEVATSVLADIAPITECLADTLADADRVLVVGRGYSMSTAKEGALKLMETNRCLGLERSRRHPWTARPGHPRHPRHRAHRKPRRTRIRRSLRWSSQQSRRPCHRCGGAGDGGGRTHFVGRR